MNAAGTVDPSNGFTPSSVMRYAIRELCFSATSEIFKSRHVIKVSHIASSLLLSVRTLLIYGAPTELAASLSAPSMSVRIE